MATMLASPATFAFQKMSPLPPDNANVLLDAKKAQSLLLSNWTLTEKLYLAKFVDAVDGGPKSDAEWAQIGESMGSYTFGDNVPQRPKGFYDPSLCHDQYRNILLHCIDTAGPSSQQLDPVVLMEKERIKELERSTKENFQRQLKILALQQEPPNIQIEAARKMIKEKKDKEIQLQRHFVLLERCITVAFSSNVAHNEADIEAIPSKTDITIASIAPNASIGKETKVTTKNVVDEKVLVDGALPSNNTTETECLNDTEKASVAALKAPVNVPVVVDAVPLEPPEVIEATTSELPMETENKPAINLNVQNDLFDVVATIPPEPIELSETKNTDDKYLENAALEEEDFILPIKVKIKPTIPPFLFETLHSPSRRDDRPSTDNELPSDTEWAVPNEKLSHEICNYGDNGNSASVPVSSPSKQMKAAKPSAAVSSDTESETESEFVSCSSQIGGTFAIAPPVIKEEMLKVEENKVETVANVDTQIDKETSKVERESPFLLDSETESADEYIAPPNPETGQFSHLQSTSHANYKPEEKFKQRILAKYQAIYTNQLAHLFRDPKQINFSEYNEKIKCKTDLKEIKRRIDWKESDDKTGLTPITTEEEFEAAIRLLLENALMFNSTSEEANSIYRKTMELYTCVEELFALDKSSDDSAKQTRAKRSSVHLRGYEYKMLDTDESEFDTEDDKPKAKRRYSRKSTIDSITSTGDSQKETEPTTTTEETSHGAVELSPPKKRGRKPKVVTTVTTTTQAVVSFSPDHNKVQSEAQLALVKIEDKNEIVQIPKPTLLRKGRGRMSKKIMQKETSSVDESHQEAPIQLKIEPETDIEQTQVVAIVNSLPKRSLKKGIVTDQETGHTVFDTSIQKPEPAQNKKLAMEEDVARKFGPGKRSKMTLRNSKATATLADIATNSSEESDGPGEASLKVAMPLEAKLASKLPKGGLKRGGRKVKVTVVANAPPTLSKGEAASEDEVPTTSFPVLALPYTRRGSRRSSVRLASQSQAAEPENVPETNEKEDEIAEMPTPKKRGRPSRAYTPEPTTALVVYAPPESTVAVNSVKSQLKDVPQTTKKRRRPATKRN